MNTDKFYLEKLNEYNSEIQQVGWNDEDKAIHRYRFASELIQKNGNGRVVDVGCGLGTLIDFLDLNFVDYIGIDICSHYITKAQENRPLQQFELANVYGFNSKTRKPIDHYVSLGAYTILNEETNIETIFDEVQWMLLHAEKSVIINAFHDVVETQDYKFYHSMDSWIRFSQKFDKDYNFKIHIFNKWEFFIEFIRKY